MLVYLALVLNPRVGSSKDPAGHQEVPGLGNHGVEKLHCVRRRRSLDDDLGELFARHAMSKSTDSIETKLASVIGYVFERWETPFLRPLAIDKRRPGVWHTAASPVGDVLGSIVLTPKDRAYSMLLGRRTDVGTESRQVSEELLVAPPRNAGLDDHFNSCRGIEDEIEANAEIVDSSGARMPRPSKPAAGVKGGIDRAANLFPIIEVAKLLEGVVGSDLDNTGKIPFFPQRHPKSTYRHRVGSESRVNLGTNLGGPKTPHE
jgi:hypothetical protein